MSSQFNEINPSILLMLECNNLLTPENCAVITAHVNPDALSAALYRLQRVGILTQVNFTIVATHINPSFLAYALSTLQQASILTEANRELVATYANPLDLIAALSIFQHAIILTEANQALVATHPNSLVLAYVLFNLQEAGIFTEANFELLVAPNHMVLVSREAFELIWSKIPKDLLTKSNFKCLVNAVQHANPIAELVRIRDIMLQWDDIVKADIQIRTQGAHQVLLVHPAVLNSVKKKLERAGIIYTEANFAVALTIKDIFDLDKDIFDLDHVIDFLLEAKILTQLNFYLVVNHSKFRQLKLALSILVKAGILTESNLELLVAPNHINLLSMESRELIWTKLPTFSLTQANFERLVIAAEHANPMEELVRIRDKIPGVQARIQSDREIDDAHLEVILSRFTGAYRAEIVTNAHTNYLADAISTLKRAGILTESNRSLVATHAKPHYLADVLSYLRQADILTETNRSLVATHANLKGLALVFGILKESMMLTQANFDIVAAHSNPMDMGGALSKLQQAWIFNQANFTVVAAHANSWGFARALSYLHSAGILNQENFELVAPLANPSDLAEALCRLLEARILIEANRDLVATHANPHDLTKALHVSCRILTQENFTMVATHANPVSFARALSNLHSAGILTEENRAIVANHASPEAVAPALSYLLAARILTQENFNSLLVPIHGVLVSVQANQFIWSRIPTHLFTQAHFQRLVTASEHAYPMAELQRVRDQILGVEAQAANANPMAELQRARNQIPGVQAQVGHAAPFNQGQSTHTASVHRSVSESAVKLMQSYGEHLDIETAIENIIAYVNGLASSPKNDATKRCIERITARDYTFTDSSGVSTRQLLALAFTAIHDETKRQGKIQQALALFIEGLYEIQRGYNLNDDGVDDGSPDDRSICITGTFNKLMEKLNGIHPDVEVYFITNEGAYLKFPKVVEKHTLTYLNRLICPATATDYLAIKELLDSMKDSGLEPIWDKIKADVAADLWSEFREAYANNQNHQQFRTMIDYGNYSNAPDLSELYSTLEASPGYQAFLYQLEQKSLEEQTLFLRLQQHSLWANRHESSEAQHAFDKQCGLVIITTK